MGYIIVLCRHRAWYLPLWLSKVKLLEGATGGLRAKRGSLYTPWGPSSISLSTAMFVLSGKNKSSQWLDKTNGTPEAAQMLMRWTERCSWALKDRLAISFQFSLSSEAFHDPAADRAELRSSWVHIQHWDTSVLWLVPVPEPCAAPRWPVLPVMLLAVLPTMLQRFREHEAPLWLDFMLRLGDAIGSYHRWASSIKRVFWGWPKSTSPRNPQEPIIPQPVLDICS